MKNRIEVRQTIVMRQAVFSLHWCFRKVDT